MRLKPRPGLGLLLVLASGAYLFWIFAWSTLSGGEFESGSREWWRAVLETMFQPGYGAIGTCLVFATGLFLSLHGLWIIIRPGSSKTDIRADDLDDWTV